jgi:hypothetical protein
MWPNDLGRGEGMALMTILRADCQHGLLHLMRRPGVGMTRAVRMAARCGPEHPHLDIGNDHVLSPCNSGSGIEIRTSSDR